MENLLDLFIIFAMMTTYMTKFMLLEKKVSHFGPFPSSVKKVYFHLEIDDEGNEEPPHFQPATLFDRIRKLFGAYRVTKDTWHVKDGALGEVWTCPICLSFWMALIPALIFAVLTVPWLFPVFVLSLAGFSSIVNVNWL